MKPYRKHPPNFIYTLTYFFARIIFRLFGWQAKGELPDYPKFVLIFAPHTSYTDNHMLPAIQAAYGFEAYWLAAEKLFKNPLMRRFLLFGGARPVDRSQSQNLVDQYIAEFNNHDQMILGMAPKGTRHKRDYWRSGFYWIAEGAGVPIVCLSMDYKTKTVDIGPTVFPSGDIHADMTEITKFYEGKLGRHPERMSPFEVSPDIDISLYNQKAS